MIIIQVSGRRIDLEKVLDRELDPYELLEFEKYFAQVYIANVRRCIDTQSLKWKPLSYKYLLYKRKHGLSTNVWEASKTLKRNLRAYRQGDNLVIGWNINLKHKGTYVKDYARYMEYGTIKMPPRPLFRIVTARMIPNTLFLYREFVDEQGFTDTKAKSDASNIFRKTFKDKFRGAVEDIKNTTKQIITSTKDVFKKGSDKLKHKVKSIPKAISKVYGKVFRK